jgi:hypothetical protein
MLWVISNGPIQHGGVNRRATSLNFFILVGSTWKPNHSYRSYLRSRRTSKAVTGRVNPRKTSSPAGSISARCSTSARTLPSIRIWPLFASPQCRAARFTTRPMAV